MKLSAAQIRVLEYVRQHQTAHVEDWRTNDFLEAHGLVYRHYSPFGVWIITEAGEAELAKIGRAEG